MNVSIIMPLHNAESYIGKAIESVIFQTHQEWELIIIDDKSTDNSLNVVKGYLTRDTRIRLVQLDENSGAAVARNLGLEVAKGRYIAFLDSDDLWLPEKLEKQLNFMQQTGCPFTYTAYEKINSQEKLSGRVGVPDKLSYEMLLKTCYIGCLTVMLDKSFFGEIRMPLLRRRQDYGLWLQLLKQIEYAYGLNEVLARYRVHPGSISSNKLSTSLYTWRLYRSIENLSLLDSIYFFSQYSVRGVLRHIFPAIARWLKVLD